MNDITIIADNISNKIHTIRELQVMFDSDLAELVTAEAKIKIFQNGKN